MDFFHFYFFISPNKKNERFQNQEMKFDWFFSVFVLKYFTLKEFWFFFPINSSILVLVLVSHTLGRIFFFFLKNFIFGGPIFYSITLSLHSLTPLLLKFFCFFSLFFFFHHIWMFMMLLETFRTASNEFRWIINDNHKEQRESERDGIRWIRKISVLEFEIRWRRAKRKGWWIKDGNWNFYNDVSS